jgi:dTDP-4-amino-4,6-dideoxygalactose transaminase
VARIYLSPPELSGSEAERLVAAVEDGWLAPVGPELDAFEVELARIAGRRHAVAVSSGTAALHLALHALGVLPGSEVLVPSLTFVATANAVRYCGAHPIFVDSDEATWCVDAPLLLDELESRRRSNRLPAAVVTVDLYGQVAACNEVAERCAELGIPLVEDAAEALGATRDGRPAGSYGAAAAFSFNGNKLITTTGGGAFLTDDEPLALRVRSLATQARQPVLHYEHAEVGFNYRLSNLLAAFGRAQLTTLAERIERRRDTKRWYRSLFGGVEGVSFMPDDPGGRPNNWLTCIEVDPAVAGFTCADVIKVLADADIEARPVWKPMHLQPVFAGSGIVARDQERVVAERLFERGVCLPSGRMGDDGRERIALALAPLIGQVTAS